MRRLVIDAARSRRSLKRGAGAVQVSLDDALDVSADTVLRDWRLAKAWLLVHCDRESPLAAEYL